MKTAEQHSILSRIFAAGGQFSGLVSFFGQKQPKTASDRVKSELYLTNSGLNLTNSKPDLTKSETDLTREMAKNRHLTVKCSKTRQFWAVQRFALPLTAATQRAKMEIRKQFLKK